MMKESKVYEDEIIEVCTDDEWRERYQRKLQALKKARKKREMYFLKQRLYGLLMLAAGLEICFVCYTIGENHPEWYWLGVPMALYGIWCILTQRMHIDDDYYYERKRQQRRKRNNSNHRNNQHKQSQKYSGKVINIQDRKGR